MPKVKEALTAAALLDTIVEHIQLVVKTVYIGITSACLHIIGENPWYLCDLKAIGLKLAMLKQFESDQGRLKAITGTIGNGTA